MCHWCPFSLVFSLYFLSFAYFVLAQLLMQLAIKATLFIFFALFTCTRLTCPRCRRRRRRRRPPPPPPPLPPLSQILVVSAQYQGHGRRLHATCPVKDHQENEFRSYFITLSEHIVGDERAVLGTTRSHGARAVHHFQ